jgi:hypothetical protein
MPRLVVAQGETNVDDTRECGRGESCRLLLRNPFVRTNPFPHHAPLSSQLAARRRIETSNTFSQTAPATRAHVDCPTQRLPGHTTHSCVDVFSIARTETFLTVNYETPGKDHRRHRV